MPFYKSRFIRHYFIKLAVIGVRLSRLLINIYLILAASVTSRFISDTLTTLYFAKSEVTAFVETPMSVLSSP